MDYCSKCVVVVHLWAWDHCIHGADDCIDAAIDNISTMLYGVLYGTLQRARVSVSSSLWCPVAHQRRSIRPAKRAIAKALTDCHHSSPHHITCCAVFTACNYAHLCVRSVQLMRCFMPLCTPQPHELFYEIYSTWCWSVHVALFAMTFHSKVGARPFFALCLCAVSEGSARV